MPDRYFHSKEQSYIESIIIHVPLVSYAFRYSFFLPNCAKSSRSVHVSYLTISRTHTVPDLTQSYVT